MVESIMPNGKHLNRSGFFRCYLDLHSICLQILQRRVGQWAEAGLCQASIAVNLSKGLQNTT